MTVYAQNLETSGIIASLSYVYIDYIRRKSCRYVKSHVGFVSSTVAPEGFILARPRKAQRNCAGPLSQPISTSTNWVAVKEL